MSLSNTYEKVKPSIVAFTNKYSAVTNPENLNTSQLSFPPIIGTGFIVNRNGVIATNDHVAEVIKTPIKIPTIQENECAYNATIFTISDEGLVQISLEILEVCQPKKYRRKDGVYYGPDKPDVAFVLVKAKDLPALELDVSELKEGIEVAAAGFPMGRVPLIAPGWLHQITPTLQRGIISAILPFQQAFPHAYAVNIMVQGGASGSPVFLPGNGKVIGIIDSSLNNFAESEKGGMYGVPTNISYATPSYHIARFFELVKEKDPLELPADTETFADLVANTRKEVVMPGQPTGKIIKKIVMNNNEI